MADACVFCQTGEHTAVGKWFVGRDCMGRRSPPIALCETCADRGFVPSMCARSPVAAVPLRPDFRGALGSARRRDAVFEEYNTRCDLLFVRKDIFVACPRMVGLPRASLVGSRSKKSLPPANTSGSEDVLGQGSGVPSDGTSLFLMSAQVCGPGARAEREALESVDPIRLSCGPHIQYKYFLGSGTLSMDRA